MKHTVRRKEVSLVLKKKAIEPTKRTMTGKKLMAAQQVLVVV